MVARERGATGWVVKGTGLYVPEGPIGEEADASGVMMRTEGEQLEEALRERGRLRGEATVGIRYIVVEGTSTLNNLGLLKGVRAMVNRIYGGEAWWVEGARTRVECLYRREAASRPTRYVVAIEEPEAREDSEDGLRDGTGAGDPAREGEGEVPW